jgi:hypothetical protein
MLQVQNGDQMEERYQVPITQSLAEALTALSTELVQISGVISWSGTPKRVS